MVQYIISASDQIDNSAFQSIESFVDHFPTFFQITLENENQLKLLLDLLKIKDPKTTKLINKAFTEFIDLSSSPLSVLDETSYNQFHKEWSKKIDKENSTDSYGQFIFLQATSKEFNQKKHRFLIKEA